MPGQIWCARVSLGCQGHYRRAKASLKSQRQFGVPESIWNASSSVEYQGKSEVRRPIWDVNASLGCPRYFELPGPIWDAMAKCEMGATPGMLPSYLCNSMCCALLLQSNRSALVLFYFITFLFLFLVSKFFSKCFEKFSVLAGGRCPPDPPVFGWGRQSPPRPTP